MKILLKVYCFLTLLLINCTYGQQKNSYIAQIDSLIKTTNIRAFNGVILIKQNGVTKYSKAYGYANFDSKKNLKLNDQFEIMSNTKQITAVLLLKEVEKGNINLQTSIKKYLPYLMQTWADTVTVHQLLNHTHGIIDIDKPLIFKAGSSFKYGDLSNILLGKIIENITKKTYPELANELFKQFKMKNTFCYSKDKTQKLVSGHLNKENLFKVVNDTKINAENMPADGVISTVKDLAIWDNNLHKGKILKPDTYKLMTTTTVLAQHNAFGKDKVGYGYGIRISDNEEPKYIGHTGLGDGFASLNLYFPQNDVCLIVLENQMNDKLDICYYFGIEIKNILIKSSLTNRK